MQRYCGAPEVEPSDDKCADADDINVDILGSVVGGHWAELEGGCRKWATDPEQRWDDSGKTVLGGALRHMSGVSADAIQGRARGDAVNAWCWMKGVPIGQVQDQGLHRVASRPLGPRLVLPRCNTFTRCPSQPSGFVFGGVDKVPSEFTKAAVALSATLQEAKLVCQIREFFA